MILGAICARGGSKGVPNKAVKSMNGKPLIHWTIDRALSCHSLDKIVVSTDDAYIASIASQYPVTVNLRPPYLAQDDTSKWDVFRYLSSQYAFDTLVDLDVGCPLRSKDDITNCIIKLKMTEADVVVTAYPSERNPYFNMVLSSGAVVCQDSWTNPITRRQDAPAVYSLSPSVFAINARCLFQVNHWAVSDLRIHIVPRSRAIDIDTPEDWDYVEYLMRGKR